MVVNHVVDVVDIESARAEVGAYQHRIGAVVEEVESKLAVALLQTAMIQAYGKTLFFQEIIDTLGALAMVHEHDGASVGKRA